MADDTPFAELGLVAALQRHAASRVFFDPLPGGNHGDAVITAGSRALQERLGLHLVEEPGDADLIVVRGNGVLTDFYARTPHRGRIQSYLDAHPETPFVLEPSTFFVADGPVFNTAQRRAPTLLFARDHESHRLEAAKDHGPGVRIGVDDDMAMHLVGSPWLDSLRARVRERHALVVERHDIENPRYGLRHSPARRRVSRIVPPRLKRALRPLVARVRSSAPTPFAAEAARVVEQSGRGGPVVRGDISNPALLPWEEFLSRILDAHTVVSQRLHVGILAALLGKETWLDDRGYHKIRGIWELSLQHLPNVHLMSELGGSDEEAGR
jgi:exopolysaccharide biosynthesis predicted pyruvyltransferase EpsI